MVQYTEPVFNDYRELVAALVEKRRALGLSQDHVAAAAGLADGHISKLESYARIAQPATFALWSQTLGMTLTWTPTPLPAATMRAIERRPAPLRDVRPKPKLLYSGNG